jgi:hypothetical protein
MQAHLLKSRVEAMMDGKLVFNSPLGSYDAPPWTLEAGRNDISMNLARPRFTGTIMSLRRLAPPPQSGAMDTAGVWRIQCVLPLQYPGASFPIVAEGAAGNGTMLFATIMPGNRVRFGVDEWFIGGGLSEPVAVEPTLGHTVDVFFGPMAARASWPRDHGIPPEGMARLRRRLNVWLDGRLVLSAELKRPYSTPADSFVAIAANPQGFSTCRPDYLGAAQAITFSDAEFGDFLRRNLELKP